MIKPFSIRDYFLAVTLEKQGTALDLEERLIHPLSPLRSAMLARLLPVAAGAATYILNFSDENGVHQGMVQAQIRPGRPEQDVVFIAPSLEQGDGSHALWQRMLTHLCVKAGESGHQRIYARLNNGGDEAQIFRNIGFNAYAEELIFQLSNGLCVNSQAASLALRRQTAADSWSVQRLYAAVTPRIVQVAEGLAQEQWQAKSRVFGNQGRRYGYVWEDQGEILAVINVHSGKLGHWLKMMVHPDVDQEASRLISAGLKLIRGSRQRPVYCSLRSYQLELPAGLEACGFQQFARQVVMVKHITVRAKDFLNRLVLPFEGVVEVKRASPTMVKSERG